MPGDSLQPARYRALHLSRNPRRLESGILSPASANRDQVWRLSRYACAALDVLRGTRAEGARINVKLRMGRRGSSRSAVKCAVMRVGPSGLSISGA
jgi:hypothetical protein